MKSQQEFKVLCNRVWPKILSTTNLALYHPIMVIKWHFTNPLLRSYFIGIHEKFVKSATLKHPGRNHRSDRYDRCHIWIFRITWPYLHQVRGADFSLSHLGNSHGCVPEHHHGSIMYHKNNFTRKGLQNWLVWSTTYGICLLLEKVFYDLLCIFLKLRFI